MSLLDQHQIKRLQHDLLAWYAQNKRDLPWRQTTDPYHIWVSEVMLQQTQVIKVLAYYARFLQKFPTLGDLAKASEQDVLKAWEGMGYYSRARNLRQAAQILVETNGGALPADYRAFRQLPGVGDYIAADVMSIAFDQPHPVIDGNVKRVLARLFLIEAPVNATKNMPQFKEKAAEIFAKEKPGDFNQAMMELGALICKPQNPVCSQCPLQNFCGAYRTGNVRLLPLKAPKKDIPKQRLAILVIFKQGQVLLIQRPSTGLLGGLWEFPNIEITNQLGTKKNIVAEFENSFGLRIQIGKKLTQVKHAYSHRRITADVYPGQWQHGAVRLENAAAHRWIDLSEAEQYPLPGLNLKFIDRLKDISH